MKEKIYFLLPHFLQNILISIFNIIAYKKRYGGKYAHYLSHFKNYRTLTKEELLDYQKKRYSTFLQEVVLKSKYYKQEISHIEGFDKLENINKLPIVNKEVFREYNKDINTIPKQKGIVSKTGGTTGKSLEVIFTHDNMQERFAMLDDFRSRFGYKLGKRTAWFSGKNLLTKEDINKNRFWKTDNWYKVRYYSTFHIKENYLKFYIEDLIKFKTEYIVGFPSSLLEIAKFGVNNYLDFPERQIKAIFPTAETITSDMKFYIETFFKAPMYNQYASSEGAPFIFECEQRNLHLELQSGIFEVLDNDNNPTNSGKLVITSFTTLGTPLIRYHIGDSIELSNKTCTCKNKNPLVEQILGRIDDYVFSPENGKINLGNISNTLKNTKGIKKFQAIQNDLNSLIIKLEVDTTVYNDKIEEKFVKNWRDRVGNKMKIKLDYVDEVSVEKSGKFRFVKNNIKHLIDNDES